jgi:hypothetical protein
MTVIDQNGMFCIGIDMEASSLVKKVQLKGLAF